MLEKNAIENYLTLKLCNINKLRYVFSYTENATKSKDTWTKTIYLKLCHIFFSIAFSNSLLVKKCYKRANNIFFLFLTP